MRTESSDCLFCTLLGANSREREWYDEVLYTHDEFSVLPGLGAQVEGYLLIVPTMHVHSCAELPEASLATLERVILEVGHVLNQAYGPCIFFEHGACGAEYLAGGCVDHVHVHALPTEAPVLEEASRRLNFESVKGLAALTDWTGKPYVAIQDQGGGLSVALGTSLPGQFVRRIVDDTLGAPGEWDYTTFPQFERIRSTIERLGPLFESMRSVRFQGEGDLERQAFSTPLIYVARAVDNRPTASVAETGEVLRSKLRAIGVTPIDPVVNPFPRLPVGTEDLNKHNFARVESDLAWLRRCDALMIDMSIENWSYVGCVCELVYAYLWRIPTIVITGASSIDERLWLRYHATTIVKSVDEAIEAVTDLFAEVP